MVRVKLEGSLHERRRVGRRVYRAYFVLFADGVIVRNLRRAARGVGELTLDFESRLMILGKSGPSGLEGCVPEGGSWVKVRLVPSTRVRRVTLSLPLGDGSVSLSIEGAVDADLVKFCPSCDHRELLRFA